VRRLAIFASGAGNSRRIASAVGAEREINCHMNYLFGAAEPPEDLVREKTPWG
jgi:hypothetical protein